MPAFWRLMVMWYGIGRLFEAELFGSSYPEITAMTRLIRVRGTSDESDFRLALISSRWQLGDLLLRNQYALPVACRSSVYLHGTWRNEREERRRGRSASYKKEAMINAARLT